jgi:hypothetical protein
MTHDALGLINIRSEFGIERQIYWIGEWVFLDRSATTWVEVTYITTFWIQMGFDISDKSKGKSEVVPVLN